MIWVLQQKTCHFTPLRAVGLVHRVIADLIADNDFRSANSKRSDPGFGIDAVDGASTGT
jgi:hypothetical protein